MISNSSRYSKSKLVTVKKGNQNVVVITPSDPKAYTFTYTNYRVTGADRIDSIANAFYGDPQKWWVIADANPEVMKWDSLTPGTILRVPNS